MDMRAEDIEALFARTDGSYLFARWVRPIVPVVFGVEDATPPVIKGAIEAVVMLAGHKMAETDFEQGANLMIFFCRDWAELLAVPDLDRLVEGLGPLVAQLQAQGANQYRHFRFEADGAIRACFTFVRLDDALAKAPAADLALSLAVQIILLWSESAFRHRSPLVGTGSGTVLRPGDCRGHSRRLRSGFACRCRRWRACAQAACTHRATVTVTAGPYLPSRLGKS